MLPHASLAKWEDELKRLFDRVDDYLESRYGAMYPLHPNRPRRGATSNKEQDGLFNIGASYSLGIGSGYGPGYVIEVRLATLYNVPSTIRSEIEQEVISVLERELPETFPGRKLSVERDGNVYKIFGDLSLGSL